MITTIYGIPNCDTVKKARRWLEANGVDHAFHDYRKDGVDAGKLAGWVDAAGLDAVLNRRGTTWRGLPDADKALADGDSHAAVSLMVQHPALIKRPIAEHRGVLLVGFKEDEWAAALL